MLISGFATVLGIAVVIGVIGYRVYRSEGSVAPAEVTALLPKGAKIVATAVADGRIAVTVELGGSIEVRTFDLKTLKPTGRLRFATEPVAERLASLPRPRRRRAAISKGCSLPSSSG